jgi:thioredoxin-like negative regulator of GroEL
MFRKDIIVDEVQKLALLLAKLLGFKAEGKADEFMHLAESTMLNEYDITLHEVLELSIQDFKIKLAEQNYSAGKLDALASVLYLNSEPLENNAETVKTLQKVLIIYDRLEQQYHRQSFENISKRNIIHQFLKTHSGNLPL